MKQTQIIKWLGLLGSLAMGTTAILAKDYTSGIGIITASLSSAGVLARKQTPHE